MPVSRLLFSLDPEAAHRLVILALKSGVPLARPLPADPRLRVRVAGLDVANPLGMAAGFDKDAEAPDGLLKLGFGFVEVGTVTPRPQPGNGRPRLFRLAADRAVINRLGFNNRGHAAAERRLRARAGRPGTVGVNIGANKASPDRIADYAAGARRFAPLASYLAVNISSPNTPGLRDLQGRASLAELLSRVRTARDESAAGRHVPLFVKIAPDLDAAALEDIAAELLDKRIDGAIVSNTTIARPQPLLSRSAQESGGLSGRPLFARSTAVLARLRRLVGPDMALIGVGGIFSAEDAIEKIRAGADLVQLYTGLVYGGPGLPRRILAGLSRLMDREGIPSLRALRDSDAAAWAARFSAGS